MPTAYLQPSCPFRMARPRLALVVAMLWSSTALTLVVGRESELRIVGPADREQLRSASEVKFADALPTAIDSRSRVHPATSIEPILRVAREWRPSLLFGPTKSENPVSQPTSAQVRAREFLQTSKSKPAEEVLVAPIPQSKTIRREPTVTANKSTGNVCFAVPPLAMGSTDIGLPAGKLPTDYAARCTRETPPRGDRRMEAGWATYQVAWAASGLRHRPLYFEEVNAERYGYTPSYFFQPLISAGRFFATIPALPYKMTLAPPRDCIYTLGHYRPGSCVPRRAHRLPLDATAAVAEVGMIAGLILLLP